MFVYLPHSITKSVRKSFKTAKWFKSSFVYNLRNKTFPDKPFL